MKKLLAVLALLPLAVAAAEVPPGETVQNALAEAKVRHAAVFVDFWAPWCHSCYFMQKNVMTGPEWEAAEKRMVVVELDGDSPEGGYWFAQWKAGGYPTYVILDENGGEIGRILGDRPRAQFYKELNPILDRGAALETYTARVTGTDEASVAAAREVLRAYYERQDVSSALNWLASLKPAQQAALRKDAAAGLRIQRLELLQAADQEKPELCEKAAAPVLGGAMTCDLLSEFSSYQGCLAKLPEAQQKEKLAPFKRAFGQLQRRVLVTGLGECSDTRGVVEVASDYYEQIGDTAAFREVLQQGISYSEKRLKSAKGKGTDYRRDQNLADNLRFYLERLEDSKRLDALYPKLVSAYPKDYNYAFRYGRSLARRGKYAEALPYLQKAAPMSYGRNRLWVQQWQSYALVQSKRGDEAKKLVTETLADNGPWFPRDAAVLRATLDGKAPDDLKL